MKVEDLKKANELNSKIQHLQHILVNIKGRAFPFGTYKECYGNNVYNKGLSYECEQIRDENLTVTFICALEKQLMEYKKEFSEI